MNDIGEFTLLVALATAIYGCVAYVMAARGNRIDLYLSADKTPVIVWGCVVISSICLWRAFLTNDFSLQYVWAYSNIELDTFYKFASFWGGQKGSLLFWTLLLTTYTVVVHFQNRKKNLRVVPYAMAVLLTIIIFFLFLINFSTNTFERIPLPPEDGRGLNPLLQNAILLGYNHIFITKLLKDNLNLNSNISLPLLNDWNGNLSIDNLVVISNPNDSERICKSHVKKAPIFKNLLKTSIISTTDNDDWKNQRQDMNIAFMPKLSLSQVFSISSDRANESHIILKNISNNFSEEVNISDFFLNETQSQLQLAMFGFSNEFEKKTNKKLREAFSGINTDYIEVFCKESIKEMSKSVGPLSQVIQESSKDLEQLIGNIIIFSFAGHDTTGHTLTWLIYELCKNPKYKQKLIQEIDNYWNNNTEATYDTLDQ